MPQHFSGERKLDVVEQLIPLAEKAGLPMTHLAMAFAIAHPGVTSAIIGPRTTEQLDDLLAGAAAGHGGDRWRPSPGMSCASRYRSAR